VAVVNTLEQAIVASSFRNWVGKLVVISEVIDSS